MNELVQLFISVFEISLAVAPVIGLLLLCTPVMYKHFTPKLQHLLWLILAIRLIIPWNVPLAGIIPQIQVPFQDIPVVGQLSQDIEIRSGVSEISGVSLPQSYGANQDSPAVAPPKQPQQNPPVSVTTVLLLAWFAGMLLFLLNHLCAYYYTRYKIRHSSISITDEGLLKILKECKQTLAINRNIDICQSSHVSSPILIGFVSPMIILPPTALTACQAEVVFRHELFHYRRMDLWYKLLILIVNAVHWFNPLVYMMCRQANLNVEMACDADVLRNADTRERKAYGEAIFATLQKGFPWQTPLVNNFYGGKQQMKRRFSAIISQSPKKNGWVLLGAITVLVILCSSFVACTQIQTQTPIREEQSSTDEAAGTSSVVVSGISETSETAKAAEADSLEPEETMYPMPSEETLSRWKGLLDKGRSELKGMEYLANDLEFKAYGSKIRGYRTADYVKNYEPLTTKWGNPFNTSRIDLYTLKSSSDPQYIAGYRMYFTSDNIEEIKAVCDGKVIEVIDEYYNDFSNPYHSAMFGLSAHIVVEYDSHIRIRYYNLKTFNVKKGQAVKTGDVLGTTDGSGKSPDGDFGNHGRYPYCCSVDILADGLQADPSDFFSTSYKIG